MKWIAFPFSVAMFELAQVGAVFLWSAIGGAGWISAIGLPLSTARMDIALATIFACILTFVGVIGFGILSAALLEFDRNFGERS